MNNSKSTPAENHFITRWPTAVGAGRSVVAVHIAGKRWLSCFFR